MLDLDLLRSFVSVVDTGGFTRAGERVHRTQSTVQPANPTAGGNFWPPLCIATENASTPTEGGERLLSYARRLLALAEEARDVVSRPTGDGVVRLGISEDFAAYRLTEMLSDFARSRPGMRLHVRCGKSAQLRSALERRDLDVALLKRDMEEAGGIAAWPERLHWITSRRHPIDFRRDSLPLAVFEQGCLYRNRAINALRRSAALGISPTRAPMFSAFRPLSLPASASASCQRSPFSPITMCWARRMAFHRSRYRSGTRRRAGGERGDPPSCGASRRFLQRPRSANRGMTRDDQSGLMLIPLGSFSRPGRQTRPLRSAAANISARAGVLRKAGASPRRWRRHARPRDRRGCARR